MNHLRALCAVPGSKTTEVVMVVRVCVSSQCFNKSTWGGTETAEVELLSPEMACHRNTGGMPIA